MNSSGHPESGERPGHKIARAPQHRWLMILRLLISTFLLITLSLLKTHGNMADPALNWFSVGLAALGIYFSLVVFYYFLPGLGRWNFFLQASQAAADLALAICLTLITGGGDSPFSFLFLIAILNSSFWGGVRGGLVVATFSAALWGGLVTLQGSGWLASWLPDLNLAPGSGNSLVRILINTGACYLVAGLSGYLAAQLFLSRRALVRSQTYLDRLADLNENIIQSIDSGLITVDQSGLILSVNQAGQAILGRELPELARRPWQLFLPQLEHILPLSPGGRTSFFDAGGLRFEYLREADGQELLLELNVLALMDRSGEVWGRLFVLKDLTSFSQMEEAVRKAEHLAALGELAAGLAHELRTPLTSMTGAWHLLSEQSPEPEDQQRLIKIIGREMERLAKLTTDFLSFARPARANPKAFVLDPLVADQLKLFQHSRQEGMVLESRLGAPPPVYFDEDQIRQIIWNLLMNAVEAGEKSEHLHILVETGLAPAWPDHVSLRISDNGPGIAHENLTKIFEPFFTTKSSGNGLGLPTINRILHEGNGHITVTSSMKGVTTFTVLLPQMGRTGNIAASAPGRRPKMNINFSEP
ncbi:MAG: PAS domain S-box protein [Candidatus Adiutrix sp.]|jgi:two-component system sensor histidine kinase PilS (NtrC family)|nr:PAS domain S-box protein [Candidatus Adiutrix sp.]